MRKAMLRAAGLIPKHDEATVFAAEVSTLSGAQRPRRTFDWAGFAVSAKGVFLEGVEVAFIVLALGATSGGYVAPAAGAGAALLLVAAVGAALRRPLTRVPENALKCAVGAMLVTFGVYWTAEGLGVAWTGGAARTGVSARGDTGVVLDRRAVAARRSAGADGGGSVNRVVAAVRYGVREAFGLLVDDGAVAVGILLAVGMAALLSSDALLGASEAVGWALFALLWVAFAVSLQRARVQHRGDRGPVTSLAGGPAGPPPPRLPARARAPVRAAKRRSRRAAPRKDARAAGAA